MATCNRCDAEIVWVQPGTWSGRWLALDASPSANGEWVKLNDPPTGALKYDDPDVKAVLAHLHPQIMVGMRHRAHSATCDLRGLHPVGERIDKAVPR